MITINAKRPSLIFASILAVALCVALTGCGGSSSQSASAASSSASASTSFSSESVEEDLTFGEKTPTALSIVFTNDTGADITALSATPATGEGAAVQLMQGQDVFPAGKQATVYIEPSTSNGVYNLAFTNGVSTRQLHNIDFNRSEKASIRVEGKTAYISMTVDGKTVSTLQDELNLASAASADAAAAAPAAAAAAATATAATDDLSAQAAENAESVDGDDAGEPEANDDAADDGGNGEEVYYEESYADDAGDAPAQSEDHCVTDVILN